MARRLRVTPGTTMRPAELRPVALALEDGAEPVVDLLGAMTTTEVEVEVDAIVGVPEAVRSGSVPVRAGAVSVPLMYGAEETTGTGVMDGASELGLVTTNNLSPLVLCFEASI